MSTPEISPAPARPAPTSWVAPWRSTTAVGLATLTFLVALDLVHQLTATTYASAPLPYAFLGAIDGFIALTVAAITRLRQSAFMDEDYAWKLAAAAMAVRAITIVVLHSLADRQDPGGPWTLADILVLAMSACAPLMPLSVVHLYILAAEHTAHVAQQRRLRSGDL